jgi:hypothetical protein
MQHCFWAHNPGGKVGDSLFVLGADTFRSGSKTRRRLAKHTSVDQQSANGKADLKFGNFLPNDRIGRVGHLAGMQVQRPVRNQTIDPATLMFKLTHCLRRRASTMSRIDRTSIPGVSIGTMISLMPKCGLLGTDSVRQIK